MPASSSERLTNKKWEKLNKVRYKSLIPDFEYITCQVAYQPMKK